MNKTILYEEHKKLGGNIVDFAGWMLPVMYASIIEEHLTTRSAAAVFDICHMGEFRVIGNEAKKLLGRILPTRLDKISPGKSMYSCLCNKSGKVIDDIFVFMISDNEYYIVVNASNIEADFKWISENNSFDVKIINESNDTAKIDLQGPKSLDVLKEIIKDKELISLERFSFYFSKYNNEKIMISNTGYTGEKGYELFINNKEAVSLWKELLDKGSRYGIKPAGLGARDSLRIEASYSLYGHELSLNINPYEAGIGWLVSSKEDFIGKEALLKYKEGGIKKTIFTLSCIEKGIPRQGCNVSKGGVNIGVVSSGVFSPTFKKGIALASLDKNSVKIGDSVDIIVRDKNVKAEVVERPFYKYNG